MIDDTRFVLRAYYLSRANEVIAIESLPLTPIAAADVWLAVSRATRAEWWTWGHEPPALKHGARKLVQPRWRDVKDLRAILIAERVASRVGRPPILRTSSPPPPKPKKKWIPKTSPIERNHESWRRAAEARARHEEQERKAAQKRADLEQRRIEWEVDTARHLVNASEAYYQKFKTRPTALVLLGTNRGPNVRRLLRRLIEDGHVVVSNPYRATTGRAAPSAVALARPPAAHPRNGRRRGSCGSPETEKQRAYRDWGRSR